MELVLLVVAVPMVWFLLLPARALGRVRRHPFATAGALAALLVTGWFAIGGLRGEPADYGRGDVQLRALLD